MQYIENKTFDEIRVGDRAALTRTLVRRDIELFAMISGDVNPAHVDTEFAKSDIFHKVIAQGMWGETLISAVLGTELPGPGTVYLDQSLRFLKPVELGDIVTVRVIVREKRENRRVLLDCQCTNQTGEVVIDGAAEVIAPDVKMRRPRGVLPDFPMHEPDLKYHQLLDATRDLTAIRTAVIHPCDAVSLGGAMAAFHQGLILPVLVGPEAKIRKVADEAGCDLSGVELVNTPHSHAAAEQGVALARACRVEALMKGSLHTDELMSAVISKETGLRTGRRLSHVFAFDVPHYPKPLFITDAALNIAPDLDDKRDIVQNAIDLAQALGISMPKVAILSAVETISSKIASTIEAAALCKMAERGQITGGLLDGPLAFDNAISKAAAKTKGIVSEVAGDADILVVPDLEAGNMLAKQLVYLAGASVAGIVLGARVPIMLTSRADGELSRLASAALALLFVHRLPRVIA